MSYRDVKPTRAYRTMFEEWQALQANKGGRPPGSTTRDLGTNARAMGTNPRAQGTNPRALRRRHVPDTPMPSLPA